MPSIVKRGNTYRIFVSLGRDGNGKQVRKTTTFHPPKGISEKKARMLVESEAYEFEQRLRYFDALDDSCTVSVFLEWYFETIAPNKLKERTLCNEKKLMENYVLPRIGRLRLRDVTSCRIDEMLSELRRCGGVKKKGP